MIGYDGRKKYTKMSMMKKVNKKPRKQCMCECERERERIKVTVLVFFN